MGAKAAMGRKKSDPPGQPPRERVLVVRGTEEWKAWLERACVHCRMNASSLADIAIAEYVKAHGFEEAPPPR